MHNEDVLIYAQSSKVPNAFLLCNTIVNRSSPRATITALLLAMLCLFVLPSIAADSDYIIYLVCESGDQVVRVRFGSSGSAIEKMISTAAIQSDISGPHGIAVAPDRSAYYVTLGHGRPFGSAQKYSGQDDKLIGKVLLGLFPATIDVTPDGNFIFAVNFNLHGDMVPSSVSVVETAEMMEVARIPTCTMPHGSRVNRDGTRHYSVCMMDDILVEIDTRTLRVTRYFRLTKGSEAGFSVSQTTNPPRVKSQVPFQFPSKTNVLPLGRNRRRAAPKYTLPAVNQMRLWK